MAAEHWFRWHHGCVTDPKFRVIASRCVTNVTVGHVVAVWAAMMENASMASPRGALEGWDDEDVAAGLGFTTDQVHDIREAMQGKTLDGDSLTGWKKRQPNREDSSAERTREYRERKSKERDALKRSVTQCDAEKREVTLETETETEVKEQGASPIGDALPVAADPIPYQAIVDAYNGTMTGLPKVRALTPKRRTLIRRAWQAAPEFRSVEFFRDRYFPECQEDAFHNGTGPYRNGHENWRPDFDYLLRPDVVTKVYERALDAVERGDL